MRGHLAFLAVALPALTVADVITRVPDAAPPGYEQWISPVVVPARNVSGDADWASAVARARAFVNKLTLEEKVNVTTGIGAFGRCVGQTGTIPRFGWGGLCLQDSPLGVRSTDFVSGFPAGLTVASTWDKELFYRRGKAIGAEFRGKGINVALGPMTNLGRVAAGGRNWEGFGADPYLAGIATEQSIKGIQDNGVIANVKHFVANEQEHYRGGRQATQIQSSNVDDRTMHEVYVWPFADAVHAGVGSLMCSYNKINQTQACQNSKLLNGILREELDFQGFVVSDWTAAINGVQPALAGMDMNMPGFITYGEGAQNETDPANAQNSFWGAHLVEAVRNGSVPEGRVTDMAVRTFAAWYKLGQDKGYPAVNFNTNTEDTIMDGWVQNEHVNVQADHYKVIREIGSAGTVLLKNTKGALPLNLDKIRRIGIFGSDAGPNPNGPNSCGRQTCDAGTLAAGWGSGTATFPYLIDPLAAIQSYVNQNAPTTVLQAVLNDSAYSLVAPIARHADTCLVFVNANSGESFLNVGDDTGDRTNLTLWHSGEALIKATAAECSNTIVTMHTVGPVIVEDWIDHPNVTAVIQAHLPGQESGNSLVDVLFGKVNPSGRLPYTIAKARADYPADVLYSSTMDTPQITYSEALNIDYRHFDANGVTPRYEFGYGLSYTSFSYSGLRVNHAKSRRDDTLTNAIPSASSSAATGIPPVVSSASSVPSAISSIPFSTGSSASSAPSATSTYSLPPASSSPLETNPGGAAKLWENVVSVSFSVKNTGKYDGHEVSQLYLGFPKGSGEPPRILRGFERTFLRRGQSQTVTLQLRQRDISIWDVLQQKWVVPKGTFKVEVGSSSRKIHLTGTFQS